MPKPKLFAFPLTDEEKEKLRKKAKKEKRSLSNFIKMRCLWEDEE